MGAVAAKVIRPVNIDGVDMNLGDELTVEQWDSIAPHIQDALIGGMRVRRVFQDEAEQAMRFLVTRIETLEAKVADLMADKETE